jgi:hypothetical protein
MLSISCLPKITFRLQFEQEGKRSDDVSKNNFAKKSTKNWRETSKLLDELAPLAPTGRSAGGKSGFQTSNFNSIRGKLIRIISIKSEIFAHEDSLRRCPADRLFRIKIFNIAISRYFELHVYFICLISTCSTSITCIHVT